MDHLLIDLMHECVVDLTIPGESQGTGFFVTPEMILTCAHVVGNTKTGEVYRGDINVRWKKRMEFAKARVIPGKWFSEIDVALLSFSVDQVDELPCVYLGEELKAGDELATFGYSYDFPNGGPATVEFEGYTGDEPPVAKFKLGNIRPGMSGAPLLNRRTGYVCGIVNFTLGRGSIIGGGGVTTRTIIRHCKELAEPQKQFHDQDDRWRALMGPGFQHKTPDELADIVQKKIAEILADENMQPLRGSIGDILTKKESKKSLAASAIAKKLVRIDMFEKIDCIAKARENTLEGIEKKGGSDADAQRVFNGTSKIIGWLVLLAVNTAWLSKKEGALCSDMYTGAIMLPVKTAAGVEIFQATWEERAAEFETEGIELFGKKRMPKEILEVGFDDEDTVSAVKKAIFEYIFTQHDPTQIGDLEVDDELVDRKKEWINSHFRRWSRRKKTRYLVVQKADVGNPMRVREVYEKLLGEYEDLRIIFLDTETDGTALCVDEIDLGVDLLYFFRSVRSNNGHKK